VVNMKLINQDYYIKETVEYDNTDEEFEDRIIRKHERWEVLDAYYDSEGKYVIEWRMNIDFR